RIAPFQRKCRHLVRSERVAEAGVLGVHQRSLTHHVDLLGCPLDAQRLIESGGGVHQQTKIPHLKNAEPGRLEGDRVSSRRDFEKLIEPLTIGFGGSRKGGGGVCDRHFRSRNYRSFGIHNSSAQRSRGGLRPAESSPQDSNHNQQRDGSLAALHGTPSLRTAASYERDTL